MVMLKLKCNFAYQNMSDSIKHECGIALIRLKKPLDHYRNKYGTRLYGLNKLYLLMEKQHNRGQDGAGIATVKLNAEPGHPYIYRHRSVDSNGISLIFEQVKKDLEDERYFNEGGIEPLLLTTAYPFIAELMLGHLRYATHSKNGTSFCHPFIRQSNWMNKNLVMAGNFNMTNNDELFERLIELGQHPRNRTDTVTVLEKIGHYLDVEVDTIYEDLKNQGILKVDMPDIISKRIKVEEILRNAARDFDGGYAMAGMIGHGDAFVLRDPNGIRPAFWYEDDEVVVVTSERPPIKTAFNIDYDLIQEIPPGNALIIKADNSTYLSEILPPRELKQCSFERIYFSRGTDRYIYRERKNLGKLIAPAVLDEVNHDLDNTVFSYIPNTAEVAFYGMMEQIDDYLNERKKQRILEGEISQEELSKLLAVKARTEKIAVKDAKLRTFISPDNTRNELVSHVYDTTYGVLNKYTDSLVIIDDSIVRGTTLKNSIIRILDRLHPKKIIVVSSAPQIRYPDCYGIDMSRLKDFVAFKAAIELLEEADLEHIIDDVYSLCKQDRKNPDAINHVKMIYEPFTDTQISKKISELLTPKEVNAEVTVIYQTIESLHLACPQHTGDWYFTGNYPTRGGNRVANRSFINYIDNNSDRAY